MEFLNQPLSAFSLEMLFVTYTYFGSLPSAVETFTKGRISDILEFRQKESIKIILELKTGLNADKVANSWMFPKSRQVNFYLTHTEYW